VARAGLDEPGCRRPRRSLGARLAALLPRRRRRSARCGDLPWDDGGGLAPALVPRRPRPPRLGGAVALELPDDPG
jgi:hypothetical protein